MGFAMYKAKVLDAVFYIWKDHSSQNILDKLDHRPAISLKEA